MLTLLRPDRLAAASKPEAPHSDNSESKHAGSEQVSPEISLGENLSDAGSAQLEAQSDDASSGVSAPERSGSSGVSFLVFGDWGGLPREPFVTPAQLKNAEAMNRVSLATGAACVASVGDHFYLTGVMSTEDIRWQRTFEDVYTGPGLQIPWYLCPGNHDYDGNVMAQIMYSKRSARWNMPSNYHAQTLRIDDDHSALLVFLDTNTLCEHGRDRRQYVWLRKQLAASDHDAIFLFGHHPVFSNGWNHGPTRCLEADPIRMSQLMREFGVSAYFAGHDHQLEHLELEHEDGSTTDFFVSGAGSAVTPRRNYRQAADSKFFWVGDTDRYRVPPSRQYTMLGGFMSVRVTPETWGVDFFDCDGAKVYSYERSLSAARMHRIRGDDSLRKESENGACLPGGGDASCGLTRLEREL